MISERFMSPSKTLVLTVLDPIFAVARWNQLMLRSPAETLVERLTPDEATAAVAVVGIDTMVPGVVREILLPLTTRVARGFADAADSAEV